MKFGRWDPLLPRNHFTSWIVTRDSRLTSRKPATAGGLPSLVIVDKGWFPEQVAAFVGQSHVIAW